LRKEVRVIRKRGGDMDFVLAAFDGDDLLGKGKTNSAKSSAPLEGTYE